MDDHESEGQNPTDSDYETVNDDGPADDAYLNRTRDEEASDSPEDSSDEESESTDEVTEDELDVDSDDESSSHQNPSNSKQDDVDEDEFKWSRNTYTFLLSDPEDYHFVLLPKQVTVTGSNGTTYIWNGTEYYKSHEEPKLSSQ